ncbi:putative membrane protein YeiH [Litorimonas taeanensis]|uniref:Putative membrane protein YeiH n=1 Tax=Litorimonas taeanensis TaxID=568099 RepID=A0A420WDR0_9PROT|nr:trimeric intracellular cation channel family protein [Litorimonas taeanensis]RKQ69157.1 putative membrane protein YeiH [Litorimonas taeanensis]
MTSAYFLDLFDWVGVFVFAVSGGLIAVRQRMDIFGVVVIALLPAIGGGTLRDVLLGQPVFWLSDQISLLIATGAGFAAFLAPRFWTKFKSLRWLDSAGLALFAVVGASKAYSLGYGFVICTIMGTITATAGGLLRDVVCNETPMLLKSDIYATAAFSGAAAYVISKAQGGSELLSLSLGAGLVFLLRAVTILYKLNLPTSKGD